MKLLAGSFYRAGYPWMLAVRLPKYFLPVQWSGAKVTIIVQVVQACWRIVHKSTILWSSLVPNVSCYSILHSICSWLGYASQSLLCLDRSRYTCKDTFFPYRLMLSAIFKFPIIKIIKNSLSGCCFSSAIYCTFHSNPTNN